MIDVLNQRLSSEDLRRILTTFNNHFNDNDVACSMENCNYDDCTEHEIDLFVELFEKGKISFEEKHNEPVEVIPFIVVQELFDLRRSQLENLMVEKYNRYTKTMMTRWENE